METHEAPSEKLIDLIMKLHAKAESCKEIGSLEEAAIFAAKVEDLLLKHKLSLSELSFEAKERKDPLGRTWLDWGRVEGMGRKRKRTAWVEDLCSTVAQAHFCRIIVSTGSSNVAFVGRETDRQVAEFMSITLVRLADELAVKGYWKARHQAFKTTGTYNTQAYKMSFLNAFVARISERYNELRKQNHLSGGTALVLQKSRQEVQKFMDDLRAKKETSKAATVQGRKGNNSQAHQDGRKAAGTVNLKAAALGEGGTPAK